MCVALTGSLALVWFLVWLSTYGFTRLCGSYLVALGVAFGVWLFPVMMLLVCGFHVALRCGFSVALCGYGS